MPRNSRQTIITPMTDVKIQPPLLNAIKALKNQAFTVDTLVEAYLAQPDSAHCAKKPARQFVYRNMQRLMRAGLMVKDDSQPGWPLYTITVDLDPNDKAHLAPGAGMSSKNTRDDRHTPPLEALKKRLGQYQSDMLCAMGEAEEYRQVSQQWPELFEKTQPLYHDSRERSAILLGKIKALETMINRHGE
ncbi:MAG: hypothetical protein MI976_13960 [Pseudomonadales bacterium]|nr:hypothetical protein [Pseudomonadales bacterium]